MAATSFDAMDACANEPGVHTGALYANGTIPDLKSWTLAYSAPSTWRFCGTSLDVLAGLGLGEAELKLLATYGRRTVQHGLPSLYVTESVIASVRASHGVDLSPLYHVTLFFNGATGLVQAKRYTPQGDPNCSDRFISGYVMTDHAIARLHRRGFTRKHVAAALEFGEHVWGKGASKYILTRRQVENAAELGFDVSEYVGTTVVVAATGRLETMGAEHGSDGKAVIQTIYANNDISHARRHKLFQRDCGRFARPRRGKRKV